MSSVDAQKFVKVQFRFLRDDKVYSGALLNMTEGEILFATKTHVDLRQRVELDITGIEGAEEAKEFASTVEIASVHPLENGVNRVKALFVKEVKKGAQNRRAVPRHKVNLKGVCIRMLTHVTAPCEVLDISTQGVGFLTSSIIKKDEQVVVVVKPDPKKPIGKTMKMHVFVCNARHVGNSIYKYGCKILKVEYLD